MLKTWEVILSYLNKENLKKSPEIICINIFYKLASYKIQITLLFICHLHLLVLAYEMVKPLSLNTAAIFLYDPRNLNFLPKTVKEIPTLHYLIIKDQKIIDSWL